jgi:hypothetical protein
MTYRFKNKCRINGICSNYRKNKEPQKQRFKEKSKFNFQIRDKIRFGVQKREHKN